jgi:hypothetical protein
MGRVGGDWMDGNEQTRASWPDAQIIENVDLVNGVVHGRLMRLKPRLLAENRETTVRCSSRGNLKR